MSRAGAGGSSDPECNEDADGTAPEAIGIEDADTYADYDDADGTADSTANGPEPPPADAQVDAAGAAYVLNGPPMAGPAIVHDTPLPGLDLRIGPMWSVAVDALRPEDVAAHLAALLCEPNKGKRGFGAGRGALALTSFRIGDVRDGRLRMPAWYARQAFPWVERLDARARSLVPNAYTRGEPMRPDVTFGGKLFRHPPQQQAARRYLDWLTEQDGMNNVLTPSCIISLPCGYGKTVLFLSLAVALGRVTLVLAHKLALVDQWITEARAFLPGARVGYIKSEKDGGARIEGVDIIIASTQSLVAAIDKGGRGFVDRLWERCGLVAMDEGHHAVASTFSRVLAACPARYRIVLTATPRRKDGLLPQLQWVAGPVIFRAFRKVGDVHVLDVKYVNPAHVEITRFKEKALMTGAMINALADDPVRTALAVALITKLAVEQRRRVLVVTPRVQHVEALGEALGPALAAALAAAPPDTRGRGPLERHVKLFETAPPPRKRRKLKTETDEEAAVAAEAARQEWEDTGPHGSVKDFVAPPVGLVKQGMKPLARELAYESAVVVTTSQMMEEGISYKQWDTLVDLGDSGDAEQVVGRILRACDDKRVPLVIDVWIQLSFFHGLWHKRRMYYDGEGFARRSIQARTAADLPTDKAFWDVYDVPAAPTL